MTMSPSILRRGASVLALCLCLCVSAVAHAAASDSILLSGKVVSPVTRAVPMPFAGIVDEVLVKPGDAVEQGQVLVVYHLQEETERILQREVLMGAGTDTTLGQILDLERTLSETIAQRNKTRQLVASRLGSSQGLNRLEGSVRSLQQRIELLRNAIKNNEIAFEARLKELSRYFGKPIRQGDPLPEQLVLTAPIAGHVLDTATDLAPGTLLAEKSSPVTIGTLNPMRVQVQVYEADVNTIKEGDPATVKIPALGDKTFAATVDKISWYSTDMKVGTPSFYNIELTVPNPEFELKPGFKVVAEFAKKPH